MKNKQRANADLEKRNDRCFNAGGVGNKFKLQTSVFLLTLFVLISCSNNDELFFDITTIPDGMGAVSLSVEGTEGRTILPQVPDFRMYELTFFAVIDETRERPMVTIDRPIGNLEELIYLLPGRYRLLVTAYIDEAKKKPVAQDRTGVIEIVAGSNITQDIHLRAFTPDRTGEGSFLWNLKFPADIASAVMTIAPIGGSVLLSVDLYWSQNILMLCVCGYFSRFNWASYA